MEKFLQKGDVFKIAISEQESLITNGYKSGLTSPTPMDMHLFKLSDFTFVATNTETIPTNAKEPSDPHFPERHLLRITGKLLNPDLTWKADALEILFYQSGCSMFARPPDKVKFISKMRSETITTWHLVETA